MRVRMARQRHERGDGDRGGRPGRQHHPPLCVAAPAGRPAGGRLTRDRLFGEAGRRYGRGVRRSGRRRLQRRVLAEDGQLEFLELRARLDRQLVNQ